MATNRELRTALLKKLGVTPQRLSQRVAQVKRLYGPMSTEDGTYVLAHQEGLDLTKYLDRSTVDRVRGLVPTAVASTTPPSAVRRQTPRAKSSSTRPVRVAPSLELVDAMLPASVAEAASRMATVYPKVYIFENSIRNVITRVLSAKHGKDWWKKCTPSKVQTRVADRRAKEADTPWHGKRGTDDIYYSDFSNLGDIITKNWTEFAPIFVKQSWITKLEELEAPRNIVAHNNPLSKQEETRVDLYFNDWIALLNERKDLVP